MGQNLYWTDSKLNHIMVVDKDGTYPIVLHEKLNSPSAISVHASRAYRYLFWAEKNTTSRRMSTVWRSYLNGTSRAPILPSLIDGFTAITGLTVDIETNKLYICAPTHIWVSDINGNSSRKVFHRGNSYYVPHRFTGITILHDYLVVSDSHYRSSGLLAFEKNVPKGENLTLVGTALYPMFDHGNWFGVTYHHASNQIRGSVCSYRYNRCDQLCLAGKGGDTRCACSLGYETNATKCELVPPSVQYLLVADQRYQKLFQIRHWPARSYVDIPVKALKQPLSIAYDHVRRFRNQPKLSQVYWSDIETGTISRSYLDGSYQEVIVYEPYSYISDLVLEPKLRLLFYLSRSRGMLASLRVINVDTGLTKYILQEEFEDPTSLAVSDEYGYVFIVDDHRILRSAMDGSFYEELPIYNVHVTEITVMDTYVYFTNVSVRRRIIQPAITQILRSDINGDNVTVLVELPGVDMVSDLTVDKDLIYWTNTNTRGVQYINRTGHYHVANIMPVDKLFLPSALAVHVRDPSASESRCAEVSCGGICLTTPYDNTTCEYNVAEGRIDTTGTELCQIPEITYGEVVKNEVGRVVPDGYSAAVECFPLHIISNDSPISCNNGTWSHIPDCYLGPEYKICGTVQKGYKVYHKSSQYFVYPEMTKVSVIVIGGGGGGYDISNKDILEAGKAGDGGNSSFGKVVAVGGKGGTYFQGGEGGYGLSYGDGSDPAPGNCTTGGTAGMSSPPENGRPGKSVELFAGAGGYSDACTEEHIKSAKRNYSGPGGTDGNTQQAGFFGGGAGAREGGTGGGGSLIRKTLTDLEPRTPVSVEVGAAGHPSYNPPGPGIVIVTWGDFQIDDVVNNNKFIFGHCFLNEN